MTFKNPAPKPWETKPPVKQWPTEQEAKAAMEPHVQIPMTPESGIQPSQPSASQDQAVNPLAPVKLETSPLEGDVISLMGTLVENQCENIVVIGMSDDGRVMSLRRMGQNGSNPYTLIGALEAFKQMIIQNELQQSPANVDPKE